MAMKTVTTKSGKTIKVELVRKVQDKIAYADGDNINIGREIVEYTNITFFDQAGKVIAKGDKLGKLYLDVFPTDKKMAAQGAVASVGNAYLPQEVVDLINAAFAELEAENPKSEEQLAMERAKAEAHARWEADLPAMREAEEFERRMNRADSDL